MKLRNTRVMALAMTLVPLAATGASAATPLPAMQSQHFYGGWGLKVKMPRVNLAKGINNCVVRPIVGTVKFGGKVAVGAVNMTASGGKAVYGAGKAAYGTGKAAYGAWQLYSAVTGKTAALAPILSKAR